MEITLNRMNEQQIERYDILLSKLSSIICDKIKNLKIVVNTSAQYRDESVEQMIKAAEDSGILHSSHANLSDNFWKILTLIYHNLNLQRCWMDLRVIVIPMM